MTSFQVGIDSQDAGFGETEGGKSGRRVGSWWNKAFDGFRLGSASKDQYPYFAAFSDHEETFTMYRRFAHLQTKLLLSKQAELYRLQKELDGVVATGDVGPDTDHGSKGQEAVREAVLGELQGKLFESEGMQHVAVKTKTNSFWPSSDSIYSSIIDWFGNHVPIRPGPTDVYSKSKVSRKPRRRHESTGVRQDAEYLNGHKAEGLDRVRESPAMLGQQEGIGLEDAKEEIGSVDQQLKSLGHSSRPYTAVCGSRTTGVSHSLRSGLLLLLCAPHGALARSTEISAPDAEENSQALPTALLTLPWPWAIALCGVGCLFWPLASDNEALKELRISLLLAAPILAGLWSVFLATTPDEVTTLACTGALAFAIYVNLVRICAKSLTAPLAFVGAVVSVTVLVTVLLLALGDARVTAGSLLYGPLVAIGWTVVVYLSMRLIEMHYGLEQKQKAVQRPVLPIVEDEEMDALTASGVAIDAGNGMA